MIDTAISLSTRGHFRILKSGHFNFLLTQVLDPLELVRFAETRLPYFAIPRFIRVMKDFPRTATQKVLKSQLRQQGRTPDCVDIEALGYTVRR